jgi:hypothetical protein
VLRHPKNSPSSSDKPIDLEMSMPLKNHYLTERNFSKSLKKQFKGFGSRFTGLHIKCYTDKLLDYAIHCRQNETESKKNACLETMHVDRVVSYCRLMQQACM